MRSALCWNWIGMTHCVGMVATLWDIRALLEPLLVIGLRAALLTWRALAAVL